MRKENIGLMLAGVLMGTYGEIKAETPPAGSFIIEVDKNEVFYGFNRVFPRNIDMRKVDRIVNLAHKDQNTLVRIVAHTDNVGSPEVNERVSRKRANILKSYVIRSGIPASRIETSWYGENDPINSNANPSERSANRRATIQLIKKTSQNNFIQVAESRPTSIQAESFVYAKPASPVRYTRSVDIGPPPEFNVPNVDGVVNKPSTRTVTIRSTQAAPAPVQEARVVVEKKVEVKMVTLAFIDEATGNPIDGEIDIQTKDGKKSLQSENGEIKIPLADLEPGSADVYAYGYFHSSEKIHLVPGKQLIKLKPVEAGNKIKLKNIFFVSGKSTLKAESTESLDKLLKSLETNSDVKIEIGGHINVPFTRPEDITDKQQQLSVKRAKAVFDYLVENGIDMGRLKYKGYGNSEMVYPQALTDHQKAMNRRVEIKVLGE